MVKMKKWYVLEWNALDDAVELHEWQSTTKDQAEMWEEVAEECHNLSGTLLMDAKRLGNFLKAVRRFQKQMKGGKPTK